MEASVHRRSREEECAAALASAVGLPCAVDVERTLEHALKMCCSGSPTSCSVVLGHLQALVRVRERATAGWRGFPLSVAHGLHAPNMAHSVARALLDLVPATLDQSEDIATFAGALFPGADRVLHAALLCPALGCLADVASLRPVGHTALPRKLCMNVAEAVKARFVTEAQPADESVSRHLLVLFEVTGDSYFYRAVRLLMLSAERFRAMHALMGLVLAANPAIQKRVLDFYSEKVSDETLDAMDVACLLLLPQQRRAAYARIAPVLADSHLVRSLCAIVGPEQADQLLELFLAGGKLCSVGVVELYRRHPHARHSILSVLVSSMLAEASLNYAAVLGQLCELEPSSLVGSAHLFEQAIASAPRMPAELASQFINGLLPAVEHCPAFREPFLRALQELMSQTGTASSSRALAASAYASTMTMAFGEGELFAAHRDEALAGTMQVLRQPAKVTRVFYRRLWNMLVLEGKPAARFARVLPLLQAALLSAPLGPTTDRFLLSTSVALALDIGPLEPSMVALCRQLFGGPTLRAPQVPLSLLTAAIDCLVERGDALLLAMGRDAPVARTDLGSFVRRLFGIYVQQRGTGLGNKALMLMFEQQVVAQTLGKGAPLPLLTCCGAVVPSMDALRLAVRSFVMARGRLHEEFVDQSRDVLDRWESVRAALLTTIERCGELRSCPIMLRKEGDEADTVDGSVVITLFAAEFDYVGQEHALLLCFLGEQLAAELVESTSRAVLDAYLSLIRKLHSWGSPGAGQAAASVFRALDVVVFGPQPQVVKAVLSLALSLLEPAQRLEKAVHIVQLALANNDAGVGYLGAVLAPRVDDALPPKLPVHAGVAPFLEEALSCLHDLLRPRSGVPGLEASDLVLHLTLVAEVLLHTSVTLPQPLYRAALRALDPLLRRLVALKQYCTRLMFGGQSHGPVSYSFCKLVDICAELSAFCRAHRAEHSGLKSVNEVYVLLDTLLERGASRGLRAAAPPEPEAKRARTTAPKEVVADDADKLMDDMLAGIFDVEDEDDDVDE